MFLKLAASQRVSPEYPTAVLHAVAAPEGWRKLSGCLTLLVPPRIHRMS